MPKARRHTRISLTVVKKKNKVEHKQKHFEQIQDTVASYKNVFVVRPHNMRNSQLQKLRERFFDSRIFIGKNRIMIRALGEDEASEVKTNIHKLANLLHGECMLFMTNEDKTDMLDFFRAHKSLDFARGGFVPIEKIERHPGPMELAHSLEPHLRKLGMPTRLKNGVIHLESEYVLCQTGQPITPEQAKLLKMLNIKLADFYLEPIGVWSSDGTVEILEEEGEVDEEEEKEEKKKEVPKKAKKTKVEVGKKQVESGEDEEDEEEGDEVEAGEEGVEGGDSEEEEIDAVDEYFEDSEDDK